MTTNNTANGINYRMWQKIESCMLMRRYSLEDLASEIGVSLQQMQRYKQGLDDIGIIKLCAIANMLSVSVQFLLPELVGTYPGTYKIWQEVERYSLEQGYSLEDLANKLGMSKQQIQMYARGLAGICMRGLYAIAGLFPIDITDLMHKVKEDWYEGEVRIEIENETSSLEYEKFESQESLDKLNALIKSMAEMLIDKAEVAKAEKVRIARGLVEKGISADIIFQATGLSAEEFA